ncbi:UNVERIFIED_CONTAM: Src substrate cortactin, partial [Eudyptes robustus]
MWKATIGVKPPVPPKPSADDDWDTDPNYKNDVSEKEARWGSRVIEGSGHQDALNMAELRAQVMKSDASTREKRLADMPKPSQGYGGKFGVEIDRVDKSAVDWSYKGKTEAHVSQTDHSKGFGGKYGVQTDRIDKSASTWEERTQLEQHQSQKDYKQGFGGKFGVQNDRKDKSAVGWDVKEKVQPHESQTDYKKGFGGKFGVQEDRKDKSALGWEERTQLQNHQSQTDYKKGFGGKFGVEEDRKDKSAVGWEEREQLQQHESQTDYKKGFGGKFGVQTDRKDKSAVGWDEKEKSEERKVPEDIPKMKTSDLRSRFEQLSQQQGNDKVKEERERRKREDEALKKEQEEAERKRQQKLAETEANNPPQIPPVTPQNNIQPAPPRLPVAQEPCYDYVPSEPSQRQTNYDFVPEEPPMNAHQEDPYESLAHPEPSAQVPHAAYEEPPTLPSGGLIAVALYDYEKQDDDEIGFDMNDIITDVEQIDAGWWRGMCRGRYGLFPANYVQLQR